MPSSRDTIFALSSGRGIAAVAVIRISGPRAGDALTALTGKAPIPRKAMLVTVRDGQDEIDQAVALWFPAPHSETGENVAELQTHGGRAVIEATLAALAPHRRPAPGRARRIHPPRLRERQARPRPGRRSCRPHHGRHAGPAASGAAPAQGTDRRAGRGLAAAAHRGAGPGRGRHRFFRRGRRSGQYDRAGAEDCA